MPIQKQRKIKYSRIKLNKKWVFIALAVWILSFFIDLWPIVFLSFFCVANAIILSIDRYVNAPIDLEFSTFSAILMTLAFSLNWGITVAIMTKLAAIVYNKKFTMDHVFMMGGYVIAALMAQIIPGSNILFIGILATTVVNLYIVFVSKYITGLSNYEILMYGSSNFIFNLVLFIGFGDFFFWLMNLF